ncbi:MAG: hypothetical protein IPP91_11075 [Betaproteobacteria bacterium]|nr:hypothetical protein [Betaproteobacteria bacterium]
MSDTPRTGALKALLANSFVLHEVHDLPFGRGYCGVCDTPVARVVHFAAPPKGEHQQGNTINGMVCVPCWKLISGQEIAMTRDELQRDLAAAEAERNALREALCPRRWTREQNTTWHRNIPDVHLAFSELLRVTDAAIDAARGAK